MQLLMPARPWGAYEGLRAQKQQQQQRQQQMTRCKQQMRQSQVRATLLPLLSFEGERKGAVELDLKVASVVTAKGLVHRAVIAELQNRRRGTASTKTRAEVRGGGRKPYKQKGTGRARRGSQRTPLRPGGGIVFGPKPRDWRIKINKKEKRLAISTALQSAAVDSIAVEDFEHRFESPRTKEFLAAMQRWDVPVDRHTLIFATSMSDNLALSSRNVKTVRMLTPRSLNLYDVLRAHKLIFTQSGAAYLNDMYGAHKNSNRLMMRDDDDDEDEEDEDQDEEDEDLDDDVAEDSQSNV